MPRYTELVALKMSSEMRQRLQRIAEEEDRSLSNAARRLLSAALEERREQESARR